MENRNWLSGDNGHYVEFPNCTITAFGPMSPGYVTVRLPRSMAGPRVQRGNASTSENARVEAMFGGLKAVGGTLKTRFVDQAETGKAAFISGAVHDLPKKSRN